jgi:UDP-N-acetylglucosamine 2-epimerase (non-hydrolysing)
VKVAIVLGTRPEIIKMAPIIRILEERGEDYFILHTGQHYDFNLDKVFFEEFKIRTPDVNLNVGSGTHGETTGKMLIGIEKALMEHRPDWVLVNGDTNTTMAGALAAAKLHVLVGHVEAGLRNYDRRMPEEYNRIVADHVSDYLFATSKLTERNLIEESIERKVKYLYFGDFKGPRVFLTGNTIVDVIHEIIGKIDSSAILAGLGLEKQGYFYLTLHREENVDHRERLLSILRGLAKVAHEYEIPMVFPIHPRTRSKVEKFGLMKELKEIQNLSLLEPGGYFKHLALTSNARLVLTDSGGIQEETCTLKVPAVVLREVTDRPEGLEVGATMLTSLDPSRILQVSGEMIDKRGDWENPYGDGHASERIIDLIVKGRSVGVRSRE